MQMGPAFLPTPLSPARGRLGLAFGLASLPVCLRLRTWRPVSNPRPVMLARPSPCGFFRSCTALLRGSSPALAPASDFAS